MDHSEQKLWITVVGQAITDLRASRPVKEWAYRNDNSNYCAKCFLTKDILDIDSIPGQVIRAFIAPRLVARWAGRIGFHTCVKEGEIPDAKKNPSP
jgi:hypothetical protein